MFVVVFMSHCDYLLDAFAAWKSDLLTGRHQRPSVKHSVHPLTG